MVTWQQPHRCHSHIAQYSLAHRCLWHRPPPLSPAYFKPVRKAQTNKPVSTSSKGFWMLRLVFRARILLTLEAKECIMLMSVLSNIEGVWMCLRLHHTGADSWGRGRLMQSALQAFRGRHNPLPSLPLFFPLSPWLSVSWVLHAWVHKITATLDRAEA